jgi:hypothetical protein
MEITALTHPGLTVVQCRMTREALDGSVMNLDLNIISTIYEELMFVGQIP